MGDVGHVGGHLSMVGAKIGVKLLKKTVVGRVQWDADGKASTPPDPRLALEGRAGWSQ